MWYVGWQTMLYISETRAFESFRRPLSHWMLASTTGILSHSLFIPIYYFVDPITHNYSSILLREMVCTNSKTKHEPKQRVHCVQYAFVVYRATKWTWRSKFKIHGRVKTRRASSDTEKHRNPEVERSHEIWLKRFGVGGTQQQQQL